MPRIGYARVSTDEQTTEGQIDRLREAGCAEVYTENASGADRRRPELSKLLRRLERGDTLVVVKIDRLARSAINLMEIVADLDRRGVAFRSLNDPIDTSGPTGRMVLTILAAVAEMELSMIRERTRAGMVVARKRGSRPGNPGLISGDTAAVAKVTAARDAIRTDAVRAHALDILPLVRALRPVANWCAVADVLNARNVPRPGTPEPWNRDAAIRVSRRLVSDGLADQDILSPAPRILDRDNLRQIAANLCRLGISLEEIGSHLKAMGQVNARGNTRWTALAVRALLDPPEACLPPE
jgi:DNA invertase Pin-like site-specific DNA recombinase